MSPKSKKKSSDICNKCLPQIESRISILEEKISKKDELLSGLKTDLAKIVPYIDQFRNEYIESVEKVDSKVETQKYKVSLEFKANGENYRDTCQKIAKIDKSLEELNHQVVAFKNTDKLDVSTTIDDNVKQLEAKIDHKMFLNNLKMRKMKNIIFANIPISEADNQDDVMKKDLEKIHDIFDQLKIDLNNETAIKTFFRIKSHDTNKSYLKVVLSDETSRNSILKSSHRLRESKKPWMKTVFCFPDLCKDDRIKRKQLIVERNKLNELLGPNEPFWIIRNLRLIQKI